MAAGGTARFPDGRGAVTSTQTYRPASAATTEDELRAAGSTPRPARPIVVGAIDPADVKDVSRPEVGRRKLWVRTYIPAILTGMGVTIRHLVRNLARRSRMPTIENPEVKRDYSPRFRGRHYLKKRPNGDPRCVACYMCATACPADCIFIVAGEHPDPAIEKYPVEFVIDGLRCIYCGYCVDACPEDAIAMTIMQGLLVAQIHIGNQTAFSALASANCPEDAIAMTRDYEMAGYHREDFIWDKDYLLNWRDQVEREDGYQPYEGEIDKERMSRGRL